MRKDKLLITLSKIVRNKEYRMAFPNTNPVFQNIKNKATPSNENKEANPHMSDLLGGHQFTHAQAKTGKSFGNKIDNPNAMKGNVAEDVTPKTQINPESLTPQSSETEPPTVPISAENKPKQEGAIPTAGPAYNNPVDMYLTSEQGLKHAKLYTQAMTGMHLANSIKGAMSGIIRSPRQAFYAAKETRNAAGIPAHMPNARWWADSLKENNPEAGMHRAYGLFKSYTDNLRKTGSGIKEYNLHDEQQDEKHDNLLESTKAIGSTARRNVVLNHP